MTDEVERLRVAQILARDALTNAAQFIDAVKQDAVKEGWWTEWDDTMRAQITADLQAHYANITTTVGSE
jgi:hypothetical protein